MTLAFVPAGARPRGRLPIFPARPVKIEAFDARRFGGK